MSEEPVGNAPRSGAEAVKAVGRSVGEIAGNSHKEREADDAKEKREPLDKIVTGKVVSRKAPWWKRVGRSMIADDAQSVGGYILSDVLIPSAKNLIADIVGQGINRVLFGESVHRRTSLGLGARSLRNTPYDRLSIGAERDPRRQLSREARARHDFNEIVLDSRSEAIEVVEALADRIDRYRAATVADLYDLLGTTGSYADQRWGWTDLSTADVRQVLGGFLLDLPQPEPIR